VANAIVGSSLGTLVASMIDIALVGTLANVA